MARIVPLTQPDNVTLLPQAVQNWRDLESPAASGPLLRGLVEPLLPAGRCLVLGAVDPRFLAWLAEHVESLTVGVRSIPDAADLGTAMPAASVRCGDLHAVLEGQEPYDLVVAPDDVARLASLEADPVPWAELAALVLQAAAPDGHVLLAVENDLGLHRLGAPEHPFSRDEHGDWTPFATWDATRPRTQHQLAAWLAAVPTPATTWVASAGWPSPAVAELAAPGSALDTLLPLTAGLPRAARPVTAPLVARSFALAERYREVCSGWIVVAGPVVDRAPVLLDALDDHRLAEWTEEGGRLARRIDDGEPIELELAPRTASLADELVRAAGDDDTPAMRRLLGRWRAAVEASARGGSVPAEAADARFANVPATDVALRLHPATEALPLEDVLWTALADFLHLVLHHGLRHPWPSGMHHSTMLEALGAMAGVAPRQDMAPYVARLEEAGERPDLTRQELVAALDRKNEELRGAWSRFHWDERRYLVYKASKSVRRTLSTGRRKAGALKRRARGVAGRFTRSEG